MSGLKDTLSIPSGRWPTFLIVGAPKAGTTSVYFYLRQHPEVFMSPVKEPHYFSFTEEMGAGPQRTRGVRYTRDQYQALFSEAGIEKAIGEASTGYLMSPVAAQRIRAEIPTAKIIVLLRNPADRAFSGYMMKTRNSREFASIADAFQRGRAFVENSFYYENLMRYFGIFPREQIGVFIFEEFKKDPQAVMKQIYRFIGVNDEFTPTMNKYNEAWIPKYPRLNQIRTQVLRYRKIRRALKDSAAQRIFRRLTRTDPPEFPAALRRELLDLYREDIVKVQDLIETDLSFWLNTGTDDDPIVLRQHK